MPRPVSINDVAKHASVSIATVSRVLNTPAKVAPSTAQRVQRAIDELGYRPNLFAQGLVTKRSRVIGVCMPDLHGEFYSGLMRAFDDQANAQGYHVLITSTAHAKGSAVSGAEFALDLIDGLITMVTESHHTDMDTLARLPIPVVVLGPAPTADGISTVEIDQTEGAREASAHLADHTAPERCYFVGGHAGNLDSDARERAFRAVLGERGNEPAPGQVSHGEFSVEWGWTWARRMIDEGALRGAGVLAANDEIAVGIVDAARDAGLTVPGDVRVVGFDDTRMCRLLRPTLSSVAVPIAPAARTAIDLVCERLGDSDAEPRSVRLTTSLAVRDSSSAPGMNGHGPGMNGESA